MKYSEEILKLFPVRNRRTEKEAFRKWALKEAERLGYAARTEENGGHRNIVIGDIETAKTVFTAHYDTPMASVFPNFMLPKARALYYAYQALIILAVMAAGFFAAGLFEATVPLDYTVTKNRMALVGIFMLVYYGLFFLLFKTFVNKNNANDNTSGVACIFETMARLPENVRGNAAFVLFDDEEKGKKGSKAFFKAHTERFVSLPVINFDCVGFGDHPVIIVKDAFINTKTYAAFEKAFSALENVQICNAGEAHANSDQMSFPLGTGVMMCARSKYGILYVGRIHTKRDTVSDSRNIDVLSTASKEFMLGMEAQP